MTNEGCGWAKDIAVDVLISSEEIKATVKRLGEQITRDYAGKDLLVVGILRGASIFLADLVREIKLPLEIDFISVSSYGVATKSSGVVQIIKDIVVPLAGKHILMIEDVVDTGLTWAYLSQFLTSRNPESIKMCTLLDKPSRRKTDVVIDYVGFTIDDKFVIGYGLDWMDKYRNLPCVMVPK